jgi:hypothetical protein
MECIYAQRYQPAQWIFVNDHSSDAYIDLFKGMDEFPIRLIHLPEEQQCQDRKHINQYPGTNQPHTLLFSFW